MEVVAQRRSSAPLVFGLLLLLMGTFFLSVVVFRDAPVALFGIKAGAVVEKVTEEPRRTTSRNSGPSHRLHLLFTLPDGEPARFDSLSTWGLTLQAGDEVPIIYRPGPPLHAEVYSARQLWLPLATGTVVSTICLLGGYFILRSRFRTARDISV